MNIPFSNSYQLYNNPFEAYENQWKDTNKKQIESQLYSYYDPFHNVRYFQIIPMVPSFHSFPNCETAFGTFNTLYQEKKNDGKSCFMSDAMKNLSQEVQNEPISKNIITLKNLDLVQIIDSKKQSIEIHQNKQVSQPSLIKKKIYKQNPNRNIVTNIGNQLITFISNKKKSRSFIQKFKPNWRQKNIQQYYEYAQFLKSSTEYYLNLNKMRKFWYPKQISNQNQEFHKVIRILSMYYLNEIFCPAILTSRKMKKQSKTLHLNSRNQLLNKLKHN